MIARKAVTLGTVRRTVATVTVPKAAPLIVTTAAMTSAVVNAAKAAATSVVASLKSHIPGSFVSEATRRPTTGTAPTVPLPMARTVQFPSSAHPKPKRARTIVPVPCVTNKRIADMGSVLASRSRRVG